MMDGNLGNDSPEMEYLNKSFGKWMPPTSPRVAVDSHPRLSGIMDTVNSTLAHGPDTRLPKQFYEPKVREIIDKIGVDEWFTGYKLSNEYRKLGIGSLVGDIVSKMVGSVEGDGTDGITEIGGPPDNLGRGRGGEQRIKFALSGCHDTTLAAILASLGALEGVNGNWPPYTSHVAVELFRKSDVPKAAIKSKDITKDVSQQASLFDSLFGNFFGKSVLTTNQTSIGRKEHSELTDLEKQSLDPYYVRIRFNDRPIIVAGCKTVGNHLDGDESFCTLNAFKAIVDKMTPKDWKAECQQNLGKDSIPSVPEIAGLP
jgi:acid phosphatase